MPAPPDQPARPDSAASQAAERHFDDPWRRARGAWLTGQVAPAMMRHGVPIPLDSCLSTVARVVDQPAPPLAGLTDLVDAPRPVTVGQFVYPPASLHITLVGCTPRHADRRVFTPDWIDRVRAVRAGVLVPRRPAVMTPRGIGIAGNQLFVQVYPHDDTWAIMRQELDDALLAAGERPISYPDKAPIHLNLVRLTDTGPATLARLLPVVERLRRAEIGDLTVARVALVCTDFVLSPATLEQHARFALADERAPPG